MKRTSRLKPAPVKPQEQPVDESILMKRSWKHRFFVEILLSDEELKLMSDSISVPGHPHPDGLLGSWKDMRGKVLFSGLEDSDGLGAEINDVLALGFAAKAFLEEKSLSPEDSYWHSARYNIPVIEKLKTRKVPCEWELQDNTDWMDLDEVPGCEMK